MSDSLLEKQRFFQKNPHAPVYLRTPLARAWVYSTYGLIAFGLVGSGYGLLRLINGKKTFF
ncbi:hypothetical protein H4219_005295 [Mycoemilia scoparia]|uniref:Uncharacterized protein n=1 Tax=Mycoemilia scoparia TaxID=417184 RepID=A0A9W7ZWR0_9FUNG|nr:hypothetical protein H4219_005295 [Mycoemilia scoparia]